MRVRPQIRRSQWFAILTIGIFVGFFSGILINSTSVYAAEAQWKSDSLVVDGKTLKPVNDTARKKLLGRDSKDWVYEATEGNQSTVVFFAGNSNPRTATTAKYARYTINGSTPTQTGEPEDIEVKQDSNPSESECDVRGGTGWFICPISNGIASGIDEVYTWISDLMTTPAIDSSNNSSGVKVAWDIMRNIANAAFIVAFLIVIYSQLTSVGISNYGIKKLVPRVVIAAILVNLSFIICAAMIDLSNIFGVALQDMFNEIRSQVSANGAFNGAPLPTWSDLVAIVLSGGAATAGVYGALAVTGGSLASAAYWLLPIIASILLTLTVVFIILAARQALLIILTVISPLAFVCYLLPGTEKFFEKWRNLMFTLVIFFPAFSVVFGGAQLAGMIILQNANSWIMVILGLAVQVSALAIAPLVFKLSGGVLGRFAGIVNNKNRGVIDRTKNWSRDRSQLAAHKNSLGRADDELSKFSGIRKMGRWANYRSRKFKTRSEAYQKRADAAYKLSRANQIADIESRAAADQLSLADVTTANAYEEMKVKSENSQIPANLNKRAARRYKTLQEEVQQEARNIAIQGLRKNSIQRVNDYILANDLAEQENLRAQAGSVENMYFGKDRGSQRVWSAARSTISKANKESIENAMTILNAMNVSNDDMVELANGVSRRKLTVTDDIRYAAVHHVLGGKDAVAIQSLLQKTDFGALNDELAQEYGDALLSNPAKPAWLGGAAAAAIKANKVDMNGPDYMRKLMLDNLNIGGLSTEAIVGSDLAYLKPLKEALSDQSFVSQINETGLDTLRKNLVLAQTDPRFSSRIGKTGGTIREISLSLGIKPEDLNS